MRVDVARKLGLRGLEIGAVDGEADRRRVAVARRLGDLDQPPRRR